MIVIVQPEPVYLGRPRRARRVAALACGTLLLGGTPQRPGSDLLNRYRAARSMRVEFLSLGAVYLLGPLDVFYEAWTRNLAPPPISLIDGDIGFPEGSALGIEADWCDAEHHARRARLLSSRSLRAGIAEARFSRRPAEPTAMNETGTRVTDTSPRSSRRGSEGRRPANSTGGCDGPVMMTGCRCQPEGISNVLRASLRRRVAPPD